MLTFLTSAKAFRGRVGENQQEAIRSWIAIHPKAEVILYGRAEGAREVCLDLNIRYVPDIKCAPSGVPYFNEIVSDASRRAQHDLQVYINSDIILASSILESASKVNFQRYLIVGQRIELREGAKIDHFSKELPDQLYDLALRGKAYLKNVSAIDYFVFSRGIWANLKPLIIGRGAYDNALIAYCLRSRIPIIDATFEILALHHSHNYDHVKNGMQEIYHGEDAEKNRKLHGITYNVPTIADADWILRNGKMVYSRCRGDLLRKFENNLRFTWKLGPCWILCRILWRLMAAVNICRTKNFGLKKVITALRISKLRVRG